ncbi:MAG: YggS family pyridoxal phosphate-dependent enzyme [Spirochaetia bacterium]
MVKTLAESLAEVSSRVDAAARRAGRVPADVRIMAVTKGFPREVVQDALGLGMSLFGENRVQEAEAKFTDLRGQYEMHLIGHLQTNKARAAAGLFACVQSIDSPHTAGALDARCAERGTSIDVLLELNTSGEDSKSGFRSRDELLAGLDAVRRLPRLRLRGLMTVGPLTGNPVRIRASFSQLRSLFEEIRRDSPGFDTLSMGMSGDFELAIEEGATLVRLGTALFGPRGAK